jgi:hypothetical protein
VVTSATLVVPDGVSDFSNDTLAPNESERAYRGGVSLLLQIAHCDSEPVATELRSLVVVCGRLRRCPAVLARRAGQESGDT